MKKTKLYEINVKNGAKMVDFAGYSMPVQYESIIAEHKAVRNNVGLFDVSHMGEVFVEGEKALDFVNYITINDASKLTPGKVQYSAMCYEDGGIVDDLLVYKFSDTKFLLVINASNIEKDFDWMVKNNIFGASLTNASDDYTLIAVQGPESKNLVEKVFNRSIDLEYYTFTEGQFQGIDVIISRTGYTGELGYELYFIGDEKISSGLWEALVAAGNNVKPAGLGSRDSLRLEMGYCLYGNDIDQTTNPLEAGLGWITKLTKENFIGKEALLKVKSEGLKRKLTPLLIKDKCFPRHGYDVAVNGNVIGKLTSGTVSPVLEKGIALAYLNLEFTAPGTEVDIIIREKGYKAEVVKLPFIEKK
ncbi:MAG: glycine cleavage system aminomethyltransferase GcvT [Ignavibacteriaceae bacterium]|nr:glycine cleavage system aminomethyltransferase GcvT [Ignavibacteriaceae bacterium]